MQNSRFEGLGGFLTQVCVFYQRHTGCPYHEVMNDVDIEDICEYFLFVLDEEERKKRKKMLEKFEEL